jgi:hypothetical protein
VSARSRAILPAFSRLGYDPSSGVGKVVKRNCCRRPLLGCAPIPKTESELEIPFAPAYGTLGIAAARLRRIRIGAQRP